MRRMWPHRPLAADRVGSQSRRLGLLLTPGPTHPRARDGAHLHAGLCGCRMTNTDRGGFGHPTILTPNPDGVPETLRRRRQWVVFTMRRKPTGKYDKVPHTPRNGKHASTTDPRTWGTFKQALTAY